MDSFLKDLFPGVYRRMIEDKDISNYCKFNSQLLTFFTSSMYLSGLITTFFASGFTEKFGRRVSMLFGGAMFFIGAAVGGAAVNLYMILLARVLQGVGLGFSTQVRIRLQNYLISLLLLEIFFFLKVSIINNNSKCKEST